MTNLFQPLDLTVNGAAKDFLKRKYTEWYTGEISKALADGRALDDIEIRLKLLDWKLSKLNELLNYATT